MHFKVLKEKEAAELFLPGKWRYRFRKKVPNIQNEKLFFYFPYQHTSCPEKKAGNRRFVQRVTEWGNSHLLYHVGRSK
ncbi:hypothetical protein BBR47_32580 [Brevibacillus brevis NBRC 100599]|uniref:Uncharacterized protein n=1 Tax=Brevibacillus brevis (strain 47 / JCM 6285 / NBRC 100599) TaxID=358681 RepID=C0ZEM6_BREBN|nr:hypothetical protein BBR47_32580 [Brevibacillus brevis NBRC 100599]